MSLPNNKAAVKMRIGIIFLVDVAIDSRCSARKTDAVPQGGNGESWRKGTENRRSSRHLRRLHQRPRIAVSRGAAPRDRRLVTLGRDISH